MIKLSLQLFLVVPALLLSGCFRWFQAHDNSVGMFPTDAKERVLISRNVTEGEYIGRLRPKDVVCAEPSPDIAQAVSDALSANLNVEKGALKVGGSISNSYAESVVQLGERLGTIQLLRDKMFRACEAYANGAISATTYTLLMSRLDKSLTTLMLAEMGAGAFGRGLASVGGAAQASATRDAKLEEFALKAVQDADQNVKDKQKEADQAKTDVENNPADESKKLANTKAQKALQNSQQDLKTKQDTLSAVLRQVSLATSTSSTLGANIGVISGRSGAPSDNVVGQISSMQRQYLDSDDEVTLLDACITALDLVEKPKPEALTGMTDLVGQLQGTNQELLGYEITKQPEPEELLRSRQKYVSHILTALGANTSPLAIYCYNKGMDKITTLVAEARQARYLKEKAYFELARARFEFCIGVLRNLPVQQADLGKITLACLDAGPDFGPPQTHSQEKALPVADSPAKIPDKAIAVGPIETPPKPTPNDLEHR